MPTKTSFNIPFAGFYGSHYSHEIDQQEERHCEYQEEDHELEHPKHLRLTAAEHAEILFRHTSYDIAYQAIAREYAAQFDAVASEVLGFPLKLEFEEMTSPREYNFETDRLFCTAPIKTLAKLWAISRADDHKTLSAVIKRRFTSRDGFISHYSNYLPDWPKALHDWDHNETGTLLIACLELAGFKDHDLDEALMHAVLDGDGCYHAWEGAVDWPAVDVATQELRDEKQAEYFEAHPDEAPDGGRFASSYCKDPRQIELVLCNQTKEG